MHPVLFKAGPFTVYSYGFFAALALGLAFILVRRRAGLGAYSKQAAADLLFFVFVGGILGARLFYVVQHWTDFQDRLPAIVFLQEGGLVWYGGFFGAVLSVILASRLRGQSALAWADLFSPVIPLAHALGRFGCFMNGCCFGKGHQPVQLYESFSLIFLSAILYRLSFKNRTPGALFGCYLLGYGFIRFILEFLRGDQEIFAGLTIPQWISMLCIGLGARLFLSARRKNAK